MAKGAGLSTTARGLGYAHQVLRRRLLPLAWGTFCPYWGIDPKCTGLMLKGQALDLDHVVPRALGLAAAEAGPRRIAHTRCNRRAGSRLGHQRRRALSATVRRAQIRSRVW
jgi:5-methylcytosine-specific restriction endonuclease McrA